MIGKSIVCLVCSLLCVGVFAASSQEHIKGVAKLQALKNDECLAASNHVVEVLDQMSDLSAVYTASGGSFEEKPALADVLRMAPESKDSGDSSLAMEAYQQCAKKAGSKGKMAQVVTAPSPLAKS